MATISAADVKALRTSTGAGMMDCKRALADAEGDPDRAVELLRERGLAKAGKRAGRATSEGAIVVANAGGVAALVELGCETDFVARTDEFQSLAQEIADRVLEDGGLGDAGSTSAAKLGDGTVEERIVAAVGKLGENIELKRVARLAVGEGLCGGYVHAGGKLGVIVGIESDKSEDRLELLARDVAMHVAAADPSPIAVDRDGVPSGVVERERNIFRAQAEQSGKPAGVLDKIVDGRIRKFFAEHCLMEQPFVKDPEKSVGEVVKEAAAEAGASVSVAGYVRFRLGEAPEESGGEESRG